MFRQGGSVTPAPTVGLGQMLLGHGPYGHGPVVQTCSYKDRDRHPEKESKNRIAARPGCSRGFSPFVPPLQDRLYPQTTRVDCSPQTIVIKSHMCDLGALQYASSYLCMTRKISGRVLTRYI